MFNEAVKALRNGQRLRARDLLARLLKADQGNVDYWLWMSAAVDSEKEQVYCLQNALKLDPNSTAARRGLVVLGALRPEEANLPPPYVLENTQAAISELPRGAGLEGFLSQRRNRKFLAIAGLGAVALVAISFTLVFVIAPTLLRPRNVVVVTSTQPPTATLVPTDLPPTADVSGCLIPPAPNPATPLAAYLCLEQTPTPLPWPTDLPGAPREVYTRLKSAFLTESWANVIQQAPAAFADAEVDANPRTHFFTAEAYRHTGNYAEALAHYNAALDRDAKFAPAYWGRGLTQWALAQGDQAAADFGRAIAEDGAFLPAYLDRAGYYMLAGQPAEALVDLEQAQLLAPNNALVLAGLALAQLDAGQAVAAFRSAEAAVASDPAQPLAYYARGRAAYALENFPGAEADLSLAYGYVMNLPHPQPAVLKATVLYHAGLAKVAVGDDTAALSLFSQGLSGLETFGPLYLARGELKLRAKAFEAARDDLAQAVALLVRGSPSQTQAYLSLAQAFVSLAQPGDAANMYRAALRNDPANHAALIGLGYVLIALDANNDATATFTTALDAATDDTERAEALLGRATAHEAAGREAAAVADLLALEALAPRGHSALATAAARLTAFGPLATQTATRGPSPTPRLTATRTPLPTRTPTRTATPAKTATP